MNNTEESLRRLKKGKKSGFTLFGSASSKEDEFHDDERIRFQIRTDVEALGKEAESIGICLENRAEYVKLQRLSNFGSSLEES